jgi:hypothetical protein
VSAVSALLVELANEVPIVGKVLVATDPGPVRQALMMLVLHELRDDPTVRAYLEAMATEAALREALRDCETAAHWGAWAMDQRKRGGREKLAYIESRAHAALLAFTNSQETSE